MLDFARRVFEARLCQPYRAQTKGKVENGVKYVRRNILRFTDDADLNRQGLEWCDVVAAGAWRPTGWVPRSGPTCCLKLAPYLREDRKVSISSAGRAPGTASTGSG